MFHRAGKPILGICRGMQLINVALGGTLIQDLPPELAPFHHGEEGDRIHPVRTAPGRFLGRLYGPVLAVNSSHHQAVDALGNTSSPATVSIKIEKQKTKVTYSDMTGVEGHKEAIRLAEAGMLVGEKMGKDYFFHPEQTMSRAQFTALAMEVAELEGMKGVTLTGFADDETMALWAKPYVVDADKELVEQIGGSDMVRGNTISAVGFYGPQGRELRLPLANPDLNRRIEEFRFNGRKITNYEMESAPLQGLGRLMGHRAMTVCSIIANRMSHNATPNYKTAIRDLIATVLDRI